MDRDEIARPEPCGIPYGSRPDVLEITYAGPTVGTVIAENKTTVYRCRCGPKFGCAIQNLALCVVAANERANARGDREA